MTGDQSKMVKVGDRACWGTTRTDLRTVIEKNWAGVTITWDDRGAQANVRMMGGYQMAARRFPRGRNQRRKSTPNIAF
jgi:hypothetical protein